MKSKKIIDAEAKKFWEGQRLLLLSPHPDDEVFGCAGTMAKAKEYGAEVYVVIFSVGDLKFFEKKKIVKGKERISEVEKVAKILKWDDWDIIYKDAKTHMRLDSIPRRDLVGKIEASGKLSIEKVKPTILAIPAPSYNQDHVALFEAGFTASRIHAGGFKHNPEMVLVYDSPTLYWNPSWQQFHPNFYVDIDGYVKTKLRCVRAYASQKRHVTDPTSVQSVEQLAYVRGREVGRKACEAYRLYRQVV